MGFIDLADLFARLISGQVGGIISGLMDSKPSDG